MPFDRQSALQEGYTDQEIDQYLSSKQEKPSMLSQLGRQAGLTARAGIEGAMALPGMAADVLGQGMNLIPGVNIPSTTGTISGLLSQAGLPQPETPIERIASAGARTLAGTGGLLGAARGMPVATREFLTAAPMQQSISSIGSGTAGQAAAEAGAGPAMQMAAGLAGGFAPSVIRSPAKIPQKISEIKQTKLFQEGAPTADALKERARTVYAEIDDLGASIGEKSIDNLSNQIKQVAKQRGFNPRIHKESSAVLDELIAMEGQPQKLTNIDTLRQIAGEAAKSIKPADAGLAVKIINKIDDFIDNIDEKSLISGGAKDVGKKYKEARNVWSRVRKSELLEDAFDKAKLQATGFENGLRVQFRSLLNNKKKMKGFTQEEKDAMKQVVEGTTAANIAKGLGKFGFSTDQATRMLLPAGGAAVAGSMLGTAGAVALPVIGTVSRGLSEKLTVKNARLAQDIIRAGNSGRDITKAYMKSVPAKQRDVQELTELLMKPNINIKELEKTPLIKNKFISDAVFFADFMRNQQEQEQQ